MDKPFAFSSSGNTESTQGGILYLDDQLLLSVTAGATASQVFACNSNFTITTLGLSAADDYTVQVTNCKPYTTFVPYNQNMLNDNTQIIPNPDFEASWNTLTKLNPGGWYHGAFPFRFMRIINLGGFEVGVKFFVYSDILQPVIY